MYGYRQFLYLCTEQSRFVVVDYVYPSSKNAKLRVNRYTILVDGQGVALFNSVVAGLVPSSEGIFLPTIKYFLTNF